MIKDVLRESEKSAKKSLSMPETPKLASHYYNNDLCIISGGMVEDILRKGEKRINHA